MPIGAAVQPKGRIEREGKEEESWRREKEEGMNEDASRFAYQKGKVRRRSVGGGGRRREMSRRRASRGMGRWGSAKR